MTPGCEPSSCRARRRARGRGPQQAAERVCEDLDIRAVLAMLARVEGPVGSDPVNGQQGAVQDHERLVFRAVEGLLKHGKPARPGGPRPRGCSGTTVERSPPLAARDFHPDAPPRSFSARLEKAHGLPLGSRASRTHTTKPKYWTRWSSPTT